MQPAGLLRNRRGWLAAAAGQTIQPHLQSFTWCACVCLWCILFFNIVFMKVVLPAKPETERGMTKKSKITVGKSKTKWGRNGSRVSDEK